MDTIELPSFKLVGLALPGKTQNAAGQSSRDCGALWQQFEQDHVLQNVPQRESDAVYAVYHQYEGDHTAPFSYFIGCKVAVDAEVPAGLAALVIPAQKYRKETVSGKMPDCVADFWQKVWSSDIARAYGYDFEVYDERSKDWQDAQVDIYLT